MSLNTHEDSERFRRLDKQLRYVYHLDTEEIAALNALKGAEGRHLNFKLRLQKPDTIQLNMAVHLDTGLEKLPQASKKIISRHINFGPSEQKNAFKFFRGQKGQVIRFPEYLHCTKRTTLTDSTEDYSFSMQIKLAHNTRGRDIDLIRKQSGFSELEEEITFARNSCFLVQSVDTHGIINLVLEETGYDLNAAIVPYF